MRIVVGSVEFAGGVVGGVYRKTVLLSFWNSRFACSGAGNTIIGSGMGFGGDEMVSLNEVGV
jgi:hypothetical protein